MTSIPCNGEFYVCEPVFEDAYKVVDITHSPIIAWEIKDGVYHPVTADTLFDDDPNDFVIEHKGRYYSYDRGTFSDQGEVILDFQKKADKRKEIDDRRRRDQGH